MFRKIDIVFYLICKVQLYMHMCIYFYRTQIEDYLSEGTIPWEMGQGSETKGTAE